MSNIFTILLLSHVVGDFYLQSKEGVRKKEKNYLFTLLHCLVYALPAALILLLYSNKNWVVYFFAFAIAHWAIDSIKFVFIQIAGKHNKIKVMPTESILRFNPVFFLDQAAHISSILVLSLLFLRANGDAAVPLETMRILHIDADMFYKAVKAVLILAIILKPVSITFYKIMNADKVAMVKNPENVNQEEIKGSGAAIGYLERSIILLLLLLGEYEAIGLVIAAKSIARFNSNIKAEFYIIGTFYGVVSTLIPFIVFWKL